MIQRGPRSTRRCTPTIRSGATAIWSSDIGAAVGFLLSDGCSYLTGQTLMVDGGGIMRA